MICMYLLVPDNSEGKITAIIIRRKVSNNIKKAKKTQKQNGILLVSEIVLPGEAGK